MSPADDPDLARREEATWAPLRAWAKDALGVALAPVAGVLARPQPPESLAAASGRAERSAWPPGGKGTTMVMGLLGKGSWASAAAGSARASSRLTQRRTSMAFSLRGPRAC